MKVVTKISRVWVVGQLAGEPAAQHYDIPALDLARMRDTDDKRRLTRGAVVAWLTTHAGEFSDIYDVRASLEVDGATVEIPWDDDDYAEAQYAAATTAIAQPAVTP